MAPELVLATATDPGIGSLAVIDALGAGGIALWTTDTVCGLITRTADSVGRIDVIKRRPPGLPAAVVVNPDHPAAKWVASDVPLEAWMREVFPGPLTVVVPTEMLEGRLPPDVLDPSLDTIGIRVVYYPPFWPVIGALGGAVVATSANLHGEPAPSSISQVCSEVSGTVDVILDGGSCPLGVPSAVAVFDGEGWKVTRGMAKLPELNVSWEPSSTEAGKGLREGKFWTEPPLASLSPAARIHFRASGRMTSHQRDMLGALAAWSRVEVRGESKHQDIEGTAQ